MKRAFARVFAGAVLGMLLVEAADPDGDGKISLANVFIGGGFIGLVAGSLRVLIGSLIQGYRSKEK